MNECLQCIELLHLIKKNNNWHLQWRNVLAFVSYMQYAIAVKRILWQIYPFLHHEYWPFLHFSTPPNSFYKCYGCYSCFLFADWFRAVRFLELMAFMGMLGLMGLVVAYMFFLREIKYIFIQWIIIGMCFGVGKTNCLSATQTAWVQWWTAIMQWRPTVL